MRQTIGLTALSKANPDDMADILAGVLQGLMKND
jgi:hypothetical protein